MYDLIIIGAGPAGITASVYAARKMINSLVITRDIGGQAAWSGDIENYTGYQFITGPELADKFEEHMRKYNITVKENEVVRDLKKDNDAIGIVTDKNRYEARAVIIASGKRTKKLNVRGEEEFMNHGLTYCATCDAPLFSGREVVVVGGGNSALDAVLQLTKIAKHIYLININATLGGDAIMRDKIENDEKVSVFNKSLILEIFGDKFVKGIKVKHQDKEEVLAVGGVFVEIGLIPNSEFATGLEKNQFGEIKINSYNETIIAIPGRQSL